MFRTLLVIIEVGNIKALLFVQYGSLHAYLETHSKQLCWKAFVGLVLFLYALPLR